MYISASPIIIIITRIIILSLTALIEYKNISKKTLQESIESEMSGDLEDLLVAVGEKCSLLRVLHCFIIIVVVSNEEFI